MATGVKPRDDNVQFTRSDLDAIQDAMKDKKFRDLLAEYCEEIRDPANQATYQKEMVQLEKERGYDVTFINPKGDYVIKTSVAGDRKAFINICSNDNIAKPSCSVDQVKGRKGMNWQIPYTLIPPREDLDHKRMRCVIYDVVFHPDTLRMAHQNKQFRDLVNQTAFDALKSNYNISLDNNNIRFPKSQYKGMNTPAVIRKEDPNYQPPTEEETENLSPEILDQLYPQRTYQKQTEQHSSKPETTEKPERAKKGKPEFTHYSEKGYTIPKYTIKQQKNVDLQDYTYHRDSKQYSAIPSQIVVEVNLPLLSSTKNCTLDIHDRTLLLISEKPAKYKLNITLPYSVNDQCGNAKFDKTKHKLIITLPVVVKNNSIDIMSKVDSGVESEENSGSQSEEETTKDNLIVELASTPADIANAAVDTAKCDVKEKLFFDPSLGYSLPSYTHNVLDDIAAFTFHVKNTEPDSVNVKKENNKVLIHFTSIGSGFVPVHYAAIIILDDNVTLEDATGEAWNNNVILQLEISGGIPQNFQIGLNEECLTTEHFDVSLLKSNKSETENCEKQDMSNPPAVEVTNLGMETNIVVSSNNTDSDDDCDDDEDDETPTTERKIVVVETDPVSGAKSILRKPDMFRSYSESSGDVASSIDYVSSDCIQEESSLKKSVRFSNVIAKQLFRYNSSIEGQKKKNQRKKSKKRSLERRKSESEAEDESHEKIQQRTTLKPRRDSGLADTSDAETDSKNTPTSSPGQEYPECFNDNREKTKSILNIVSSTGKGKADDPAIWKSESKKTEEKPATITCDTVKHNTHLYNPDKLNKGKYLEVKFKNDLIFDLDM